MMSKRSLSNVSSNAINCTPSIKTSLYDWDSPSSFTGTVKRRPSTGASQNLTVAVAGKPISAQYPPYSRTTSNNSNKHNSNLKRDATETPSNHISPQEIGVQGNCQLNEERTKDECRRISQTKRDESEQLSGKSFQVKGKASKLRMPRPVETVAKSSARGLKCVTGVKRPSNSHPSQSQGLGSHSAKTRQNLCSPEYKELFCDFPSCYESTPIIESQSMNSKPPPPYRDPPKPDSISATSRVTAVENSEKQQTKVGIKQQRKGLIKTSPGRVAVKGAQPQQLQCQAINPSSLPTPPQEEFNSKSLLMSNDRQKISYKEKVSEIRNCISRINSKGLFSFAGLKCSEEEEPPPMNSNEYVIYSPSDTPTKAEMEDDILAKPEFTSSLFKNIPVRPRKGGIPHLENYCLFDPSVDFINEKELKKIECVPERKERESSNEDDDEEPVQEVIYDDNNEKENNYFTIEPEFYRDECTELRLPDFSESPLVPVRITVENVSVNKSNSLRTNRSGSLVQNDQFLRNRTIPIESNYVLFKPCPVAARGLPYRAKKPRPLSILSHSDADSGFLSPVSPDELKFNPDLLFSEQCDYNREHFEIYTDWANYYLERVRSKKKVTDLSTDCRDGLLLADVIEAVTSFKVPDLIKKPKSQQQMFDNVNSCLVVLKTHSVGGLEAITANDICNGRLKAVLALFFALSRYKQQAKQQKCVSHQAKSEPQQQPVQHKHGPAPPQPVQQPQQANALPIGGEAMATRQIPAPYSKANGGTAIPLPATVLVQRRCPPDKVRPLPPTPNHAPSIPGLAKTGETNSNNRPGSPPQNHINYNSNQKGGNNNGLRQPQSKISATPYNSNNTQVNTSQYTITATANTNSNATATNTAGTKHSMLDKLKLFNKEKSSSSNNTSSSKSQVSKRTSSSSGFSSARSERSDSSLSLNDGQVSHIKPPSAIGSSTLKSKEQYSKGGKQSKLLGASQKATSRETLNVKSIMKHDKKDKSPSRKDQDHASADTKIAQPALKNQRAALSTKHEISSKSKQSSKSISSSKLETRSESKQNLVSPNQKPLMITAGTGIPKPMAAIKGTTKQTPASEKRADTGDTKSEKGSDISSNYHGSISDMNQRTHILNAVSVTDGYQNSPVHMNKLLQSNSFSMSDSLHSSSTQSGGLHSNSSESSVIYRPSSESGSDVYYHNSRMPLAPTPNLIPNRKDNRVGNANDENVVPNGKFHTVPSRVVGTIYEEEKPLNVVPMRPLLRGYSSHVTLPTRGTRGQHYVTDYCETDIGQGYCSDGDALRRPTHSRFYDIDNGYLSEGSGGVHGKHFLSVMRARTQLPTTIEERIRSSRGSLDSIGTTASDSPKMEMNGSPNRSQQHTQSSRNNRDNWGKMPEPMNGHGQPLSPTSGRKDKSSPSHSRRSGSSSGGCGHLSPKQQSSSSSSGRTKGVPQSFGYVKRSNGSATGTITATDQQNILLMNHHHHQQQLQQQQQHQAQGRTGHVSAVPRSGKMKVSGGTQTCTSDLQTKIPPNTQHRSFSLTGPGATQLSQSIRERLSSGTHSLPKTGAEMHVFQHRVSSRGSGKIIDGSLSDTQTYAEVKPEYNTYALWLKHSNTASSRLSEGDSLESLQIGSPGMTRHGHKILHRESPYIQSPRLNRSNSISYLKERTYPRSTKSEKMYPTMLNRGADIEVEPYYCLPVGTVQPGTNGHHAAVPWSQPTSPTPPNRGFAGPLSPTHSGPGNMPACHRLTYPKKNDEVHGSAASLLSGGSSLYGSAEERQANEVRRLKRELCDARDQVMSLSSQLSTNAASSLWFPTAERCCLLLLEDAFRPT